MNNASRCEICSDEEIFFTGKRSHRAIDRIYYGKHLNIMDKLFKRYAYPKFDRILNCVCLGCLVHLDKLYRYRTPWKPSWRRAVATVKGLIAKVKGNDNPLEINQILRDYGYRDYIHEIDALHYVSDMGLERLVEKYRKKTLATDALEDLEKDDLGCDVYDINREIEKRNIDIPLIDYEFNWNDIPDINAVSGIIQRLGVN